MEIYFDLTKIFITIIITAAFSYVFVSIKHKKNSKIKINIVVAKHIMFYTSKYCIKISFLTNL